MIQYVEGRYLALINNESVAAINCAIGLRGHTRKSVNFVMFFLSSYGRCVLETFGQFSCIFQQCKRIFSMENIDRCRKFKSECPKPSFSTACVVAGWIIVRIEKTKKFLHPDSMLFRLNLKIFFNLTNSTDYETFKQELRFLLKKKKDFNGSLATVVGFFSLRWHRKV